MTAEAKGASPCPLCEYPLALSKFRDSILSSLFTAARRHEYPTELRLVVKSILSRLPRDEIFSPFPSPSQFSEIVGWTRNFFEGLYCQFLGDAVWPPTTQQLADLEEVFSATVAILTPPDYVSTPAHPRAPIVTGVLHALCLFKDLPRRPIPGSESPSDLFCRRVEEVLLALAERCTQELLARRPDGSPLLVAEGAWPIELLGDCLVALTDMLPASGGSSEGRLPTQAHWAGAVSLASALGLAAGSAEAAPPGVPSSPRVGPAAATPPANAAAGMDTTSTTAQRYWAAGGRLARALARFCGRLLASPAPVAAPAEALLSEPSLSPAAPPAPAVLPSPSGSPSPPALAPLGDPSRSGSGRPSVADLLDALLALVGRPLAAGPPSGSGIIPWHPPVTGSSGALGGAREALDALAGLFRAGALELPLAAPLAGRLLGGLEELILAAPPAAPPTPEVGAGTTEPLWGALKEAAVATLEQTASVRTATMPPSPFLLRARGCPRRCPAPFHPGAPWQSLVDRFSRVLGETSDGALAGWALRALGAVARAAPDPKVAEDVAGLLISRIGRPASALDGSILGELVALAAPPCGPRAPSTAPAQPAPSPSSTPHAAPARRYPLDEVVGLLTSIVSNPSQPALAHTVPAAHESLQRLAWAFCQHPNGPPALGRAPPSVPLQGPGIPSPSLPSPLVAAAAEGPTLTGAPASLSPLQGLHSHLLAVFAQTAAALERTAPAQQPPAPADAPRPAPPPQSQQLFGSLVQLLPCIALLAEASRYPYLLRLAYWTPPLITVGHPRNDLDCILELEPFLKERAQVRPRGWIGQAADDNDED
ncbi:hypothetical protein PAPYR_5086 [Paratrimastix pyriformis]|uniref:Uncharacterized protein n=1 Tax=Paratrimastix pyriformis TaxID=342808 RepID=A0ABQ8UNF9_9EUKA|nr:hypothetical protein PAPYR_5086 [Paratrimastix pyriformis]